MRFLVQHQINSDESLEVDYATDLWRGGLFIATQKPIAPKTMLHVQFAPMKDAQLVSAFCQVTDVKAGGVCAKFLALDPESELLIATALA